MFEIIVLTPTLSQLISSSFWFLLREQPGFGTATRHIFRQPFPLPEALQNCPNVGNSASAGKSMVYPWHFWHCTAWTAHLPFYFGTPFHFLLKADLFFLSLTAQHRPVFREHLNTLTLTKNSCNFSPACADFSTSRRSTACCLTSYTPPEIEAGESWCDIPIQHMQLISAYFLNQKKKKYRLFSAIQIETLYRQLWKRMTKKKMHCQISL